MEVVEGGFGELALGEVQGLERFELGEVLQAGVGDRGGVEVQSFQRGEFGERLQPGVREAAAMGEVQLAQVAERAEMLQAGVIAGGFIPDFAESSSPRISVRVRGKNVWHCSLRATHSESMSHWRSSDHSVRCSLAGVSVPRT